MSEDKSPRPSRHVSREAEERWRMANEAYEAEFARAIRDPHLWLSQIAMSAALFLRWSCVPLVCGCVGGVIGWAMGFETGLSAAIGFTVGWGIAGWIFMMKPTFAARSLFHERADAAFNASLRETRPTNEGSL